MIDKPRSPKRTPGGFSKPEKRGFRTGGPGERPQGGPRPGAGKPVKAQARPRTTEGIDERTFERLEQEGLLTAQGRRLRENFKGQGAVPVSAAERFPEKAEKPRRSPVVGVPAAAGRPTPRLKGPVGIKRGAAPLSAAEKEVAQRLHKVMAQAGVASRRHSEELIQAGRVSVNGQVVTELGMKVVPGKDLIEVDGQPLGRPENLIHILLNKPKNYVTTMYDPEGRSKVTDLLAGQIAERVYPVGRLDYDTEGLLLLTNDGELANALMHPSRQIKKTYIAKLRGVPGPAKLKALEEGIELEDGVTAPAEVKMIEVKAPNAATVSIRIHEGRNRQVRRMFETLGHEVIHLRRTTLGPLHLGQMQVGEWRELTGREIDELRLAAGLPTRRVEKGAEKDGQKGPARTAPRPMAGRRGAARFERPGARTPEPEWAEAPDERPEAMPRRGGAGLPTPAARPQGGLGLPGKARVASAAPRFGAKKFDRGEGAGPRFGEKRFDRAEGGGPRFGEKRFDRGERSEGGGPRFGEKRFDRGERSEGGGPRFGEKRFDRAEGAGPRSGPKRVEGGGPRFGEKRFDRAEGAGPRSGPKRVEGASPRFGEKRFDRAEGGAPRPAGKFERSAGAGPRSGPKKFEGGGPRFGVKSNRGAGAGAAKSRRPK